MLNTLLRKVFGTKHERDVKRLQPNVVAINALEPQLKTLDDAALQAKTAEFRKRLEDGADVDDVLAEAFAVCREAARRALGMRHFDVQLIGGMVLHEGKIAEMATGEGKTLVATLPAYLNSLTGRGVHIVTVNDYLAKRDAQWMGPVYQALGLSVGVIQHEASFLYDPRFVTPDVRMTALRPCSRPEAYRADITYGTNNEFGFDYLRDNMRFYREELVQRELHYAIVDEVDSILVDEARTPLIISGPAEESTELYYKIDRIIPKLKRAATIVEGKLSEVEATKEGDYIVDEKSKAVALTEAGIASCERLLTVDNLYDPNNIDVLHHIQQALRAHALYKRDVDYVVKDGQVIIVDEFTGRMMPGRRWSDGLHQAVEAKEAVRIERENQTLATITFQNYFRMYDKLAGMTGTAETEAEEFAKIYKLDVVVIPTNRPLTRVNNPDVVYKTEREKFNAVVEDIIERHGRGQPVLVGTISIEKSERLSTLLKKRGVRHEVLNAKYHEREAEIVAQAGRQSAVTIATNMAGRGTDILLGGNPDFLSKELLRKKGLDPATAPAEARQAALVESRRITEPEHEKVVATGGLHIVGTERHESRRIDNQLRGRSGRQGDPGSSRFYLSLEDDLLRIFGSQRIQRIMDRLGMEEGEPIEHKLVTRAIATAQKRVENHNFEIRKHLLEYDDVMNKQREIVYGMRRQILDGANQTDTIAEWIEDLAPVTLDSFAGPAVHPEEWDLAGLNEALFQQFDVRIPASAYQEVTSRDGLNELVLDAVKSRYVDRERELGEELMRALERHEMLIVIDTQWKDHLLSIDHLKEGIGLRGYGQRDPLTEYKKEAFDLFQDMAERVKAAVVERLFKVQVVREAPMAMPTLTARADTQESRGEMPSVGGEAPRAAPLAAPPRPAPRTATGDKVGRNDPCPCGSGKKYKKCCYLKGT
ncbi:MAG: preprotein translocase subunit SecA [Candidatus Rokubacteria bacterium 13_1_20CM_2_68_19]|nr:MAG: preprotein translocase subunit SecA [Candidatus Rokubacteria bacterium 13_2_20CM_2_64_8]OLE42026.1 MAG: preprotein translocase subunit SecA [Candidatus Rokubacteria bacterium 13_1_20CM_2_68_19]PYN65026.1 MAG: preprotein translocase subunit SecA [Candidatus Rokubacteria bacterium]